MDFIAESSDPFVVVKFNGVTVASKVAKDTTNPTWNQAISIPVYLPCMSENIDIQLWDWSRANPDELVASVRLKFWQVGLSCLFILACFQPLARASACKRAQRARPRRPWRR